MTAPPVTAYTPRLGLTVHAMDDELDAMRQNWDKLDTSYTGVIWVTPDTVPDSRILFEGAIVAERGTGKVWRAQKNANGVLEKKWIVYPWLLSGDTNFGVPYDFTMTMEQARYGIITYSAAQSINAGPDAIVAGKMVVPVDGLYIGVIVLRFEGTSLADQRYVSLLINGANDSANYDSFKVASNFSNMSIHCIRFGPRPWQAGTAFELSVRHSSAGVITTNAHFSLTCVRPL